MLEDYPDIMTVHEVMEALGLSKNTLYALIHSKIIPAFRIGPKMWRVKKVDLIEYLNAQ
ncbi:MAG: helix-turn-helix domain-containing protein [Clostridiaceae bacterium]|nr:helix-turn-helix domain-containing protein [Clostridiaceae bacterium]